MVAALVLICGVACVADGQARALTVDAGVGMVHRRGGVYASQTGLAFDAIGTIRLHEADDGDLLGAVSAGIDGFLTSDVCTPAPGGTCAPNKDFVRIAMLVGWQHRGIITVRGAAGPAYFGESNGVTAAAALEGRLDLGVRVAPHVDLVVSTRGAMLPNIRGRSVGLAAYTLALRVY